MITRQIVRVTADNANPYTFTGTNSYILGNDTVAIVDPGPTSDVHRAALISAIGARPVSHILLTHTHLDHSQSARELANHFGAKIVAQGPHHLARALRDGEENPFHHAGDWDLVPDILLASGDVLEIGSLKIIGWETPGHCANHLCFEILDTPYILTGDLVMGWATTMIAPPDGSLAQYFASLDLLNGLSGERYLSGHGAEVVAGKTYIASLRAHRQKRSEAIIAAIGAGCGDIEALRGQIYPTLKKHLFGAASATLLGHLEYLHAGGMISLTFDAATGYTFQTA